MSSGLPSSLEQVPILYKVIVEGLSNYLNPVKENQQLTIAWAFTTPDMALDLALYAL